MRFAAPLPDAPIEQYFLPPDIHEQARETAGGKPLAFVLALLLAVLHGANTYFLLPDAIITALMIHFALVAATAVVARILIAAGIDGRFLIVLLFSTLVAGVFGAVGTMLCILLNLFYTRRSMPFTDWFRSIFPEEDETLAKQLFENITIGRDESVTTYSVVPFLEVMEVGSEAQKREALTRMTLRFHPNFAPAFKRGLQDESNTIRVQAATAISIIEHEFSARLMQLAGLYRQKPQDPVVVQALAEHYDNYAFTGLLDPERERGNREMALKYYMEYLNLEPRNELARLAVGRLLLRRGEASKAADWFKESAAQGFRSDAFATWHAEALYAAGRFNELRALSAQPTLNPQSLAAGQPQLAESLLAWSGRPAVGAS